MDTLTCCERPNVSNNSKNLAAELHDTRSIGKVKLFIFIEQVDVTAAEHATKHSVSCV